MAGISEANKAVAKLEKTIKNLSESEVSIIATLADPEKAETDYTTSMKELVKNAIQACDEYGLKKKDKLVVLQNVIQKQIDGKGLQDAEYYSKSLPKALQPLLSDLTSQQKRMTQKNLRKQR